MQFIIQRKKICLPLEEAAILVQDWSSCEALQLQGLKGAKTTTELWPPNPNELDMAAINYTLYHKNLHSIILHSY